MYYFEIYFINIGWIRICMDPELLPGSGTRKIQSWIRIRYKSFRIRNTDFFPLTILSFFFKIYNMALGPGSGFKLGQNSGCQSKVDVFTTLVSNCCIFSLKYSKCYSRFRLTCVFPYRYTRELLKSLVGEHCYSQVTMPKLKHFVMLHQYSKGIEKEI